VDAPVPECRYVGAFDAGLAAAVHNKFTAIVNHNCILSTNTSSRKLLRSTAAGILYWAYAEPVIQPMHTTQSQRNLMIQNTAYEQYLKGQASK